MRAGWVVVARAAMVLGAMVLGAMVLGAMVLGCGGAPSPPATSTAARSLSEILGPPRAHRTPAQLAEIAALIRRWERDPYEPIPENDTGVSAATAMLAWATESPDVSVAMCTAVQTLAEGQGADVSAEITLGSLFGMAAHLIEHPGARATSPEVQVAGIESALLWYAASLRHDGETNALLEELDTRRAAGGTRALLDWYEEHGIECGDG